MSKQITAFNKVIVVATYALLPPSQRRVGEDFLY